MSLRFRRSLRIAPGIRLNLGLHGAGLSVGPRGLHVGVNRRGCIPLPASPARASMLCTISSPLVSRTRKSRTAWARF